MDDTKTTPNSIEAKAMQRATDKVDFLTHVIVYVLVIGFLFILNLFTGQDYFWFKWPALGWGIGLVLHGVSVFVFNGLFDGYKSDLYKSELEKLKNQEKK